MNFAPLDNAVVTFKKSAERYDKAMKALVKAGLPTGEKSAQLNKILFQSERAYLNAQGLPGAPLVQAHDLRTRRLHGLRRKNHSHRA